MNKTPKQKAADAAFTLFLAGGSVAPVRAAVYAAVPGRQRAGDVEWQCILAKAYRAAARAVRRSRTRERSPLR